ncbi:helix-turn-helix domain-containing protein [Dactylosporangium sp. AC04546]|uniref:MarR family winged helix-turn-helix transcriptional regulator n=1 Tax=Dactylosporangium sp. AC04546 TaxID=2862460 RepID=UPI001EDEBF86|nr:helix-turn-helix domain-containing protein [Dactylosporangium sp. AC04546]WVK83660.1 helix-turn-helix domain-containing protein [Dactylosporangium sp. AC04546]
MSTRSERKRNDPDLGMLSAQVLFALQGELFRRLGEAGHAALRPRHGAVLAYVDADGTRAATLSALSGQHKQVISTLVDELVELGYVERRPDPQDRRAKLVVPTELGLDMMRRSDEIVTDIERRHAEAVGPEAYAAFKRVFREVATLRRAPA